MKKYFSRFFFCVSLFISTITQGQVIDLLGVNYLGSTDDHGTVFKIKSDGSGYSNLNVFFQFGALSYLSYYNNQEIYGTNQGSNAFATATIYRYTVTTGAFTDVHFFSPTTDGDWPQGKLTLASDNRLYGTTRAGGNWSNGVLYRFDPVGNQYSALHHFDTTAGRTPEAGVVQASNGLLYGTTSYGPTGGFGTLFSFDINNGIFTNLYTFASPNGSTPRGRLKQASNGLLYGLTSEGGSFGNGSLFSLNPANNSVAIHHHFTGIDGAGPTGSLLAVVGYLLYGMTYQGGANNAGVIFSFNSTTNTYTKLHDFNIVDGAAPFGTLILGSNGLMYGLTTQGGINSNGTIFAFDPSSNLLTKLRDCNQQDGHSPYGDLLEFNPLVGTTTDLDPPIFSIYPNPVRSQANLFLNETPQPGDYLTIYSHTGAMVMDMTLTSALQHLDFSNLAEGLYLIKVNLGEKADTIKMVVN